MGGGSNTAKLFPFTSHLLSPPNPSFATSPRIRLSLFFFFAFPPRPPPALTVAPLGLRVLTLRAACLHGASVVSPAGLTATPARPPPPHCPRLLSGGGLRDTRGARHRSRSSYLAAGVGGAKSQRPARLRRRLQQLLPMRRRSVHLLCARAAFHAPSREARVSPPVWQAENAAAPRFPGDK